MLPPAVRSALDGKQTQAIAFSASSVGITTPVARGDIRIVRASPGEPAGSRLGLVLRTDSTNEFCEILLVHSATEMACELDAVVPRAEGRAPYDLIVQTDLRAVVWTLQLGKHITQLSETVMDQLGRIAAGDEDAGAQQLLSVGPRLSGPSDPRWVFKAEEGVALRRLALDCTTALLESIVWDVDPGLLRPDLLDQVEDRASLLVELLHWVRTRELDLDDSDLEFLAELGVLTVDAWEVVGDLQLDLWRSLQDVVVRAATRPLRSGARASQRHVISAAHLDSTPVSADSLVHYIGAARSMLV